MDAKSNASPIALLAPDEAAAVRVERAEGASPLLLTSDHAGDLMPRKLGKLGLSDTELSRHIAYDIGIGGVGRLLSDLLDAVFIERAFLVFARIREMFSRVGMA